MSGDTGKDYRTRRLGSVTDRDGDRLGVAFDPKCGRIVVVEADEAVDCDGDEPDEDGFCHDVQVLVAHPSPEQAEDLARWLTEAAAASRAFFAETAETT